MASSGNFPLWSPLIKGATNLSAGNTRFDGTTNSRSAVLPFTVPTGTKFYVECLVKQMTNYNITFGLVGVDQAIDTYLESQSTVNGMIFHGYNSSEWRTQALVNGSRQGFSGDVGMTATRVLGMTINTVDNEIKMYLDNTLIGNGTISISATQEYRIFCSFTGGAQSGVHMNINCGHDASGAGDFTSGGGNADENGFGDFQNSPPSGFLALCSANLPTSSDIDPGGDDGADENPTKQFGIGLYTGQSGGGNSVVCGFQPDLIWGKSRSSSQTGILIDSSRGQGLLFSATTDDEQTSNGPFISSYNTDGFTFASSGSNPNDNGATYVAWCWRANGGTTASNSNGAISSTVQANQAAGFSIVQWTANATSSVATTVGHGLSKAPEFVITKSRDSSGNWCATHTGLSSTSHMLFLNTDGAQTDKSGNGSMSANTSTVFSVNATDGSNSPNGDAMIAYCWHSVEGYSKFGSYTGNSNNDGPFIYTGFRPRMVFLKLRDSAGDWWIYDSARDTANPVNKYISWNRTDAEASGLNADFLSNGFKLRNTSGDFNSSATILYGAWGDVPWKYNNTF